MTLRNVPPGQPVTPAWTKEVSNAVNDLTDVPWIPATLENSWVAFDTSNYHTAEYRKIGDVVYLRGLVKSGSAADADIFTLGAGYKPSRIIIVPGVSFAGAGQVRIFTNGGVRFHSGGSTTWNSLGGISFSVADPA